MKIHVIKPLFIFGFSLAFLFSCHQSKTGFTKIDCSGVQDSLQRALCESYNMMKLDKRGNPEFDEAERNFESKYYYQNKIKAKEVSNRLKSDKKYGDKILGDRIDIGKAHDLETNAFDYRDIMYNYLIDEDETQDDYRHGADVLYDLERSVYFDWGEINDWITDLSDEESPGYNIPKENLGLRIYFGAYDDTGDGNSVYRRRSTVILRAMKKEEIGGSLKILRIPYENGKVKVTYNLGGLCPPVCSELDNSDQDIGNNLKAKP